MKGTYVRDCGCGKRADAEPPSGLRSRSACPRRPTC
jgi:hypothetical protein